MKIVTKAFFYTLLIVCVSVLLTIGGVYLAK